MAGASRAAEVGRHTALNNFESTPHASVKAQERD